MPPKILRRCDLCKNWQAIYILNDPEHGKIKVCHKCWQDRHHLSLPFKKENPLKFHHVVVDANNPPDPDCKVAGDLDNNGLVDLLAASAKGGGVWWYRAPDWSKHLIAEGTYTTDMAVGDIDGDGFLDVVIPEQNVGLIWFQNPLAEGKDPASTPWKATNISPIGAGMHDIELADLDNDGRLEIVTRHQSGFGSMKGNQIYLWKQQEDQTWAMRTFACPHGEGLAVCDIDGDGRIDIIIGGRWYQNPSQNSGDILTGEWREHLFISQQDFEQGWTNGDVMVACGDLDGDGQPEIVLSPSEGKGRLAWFDPPADPRHGPWTSHLLAETDHAHGLNIGDIDGDGELEIAVAKMHQASSPQEVVIYKRSGAHWDKTVLSTTGSHCICLVDLTGSGKLSLFGANWNNASPTGGAIELWVQE